MGKLASSHPPRDPMECCTVGYASRERAFMQGIVVSFRFNFRVEIWTDEEWKNDSCHVVIRNLFDHVVTLVLELVG